MDLNGDVEIVAGQGLTGNALSAELWGTAFVVLPRTGQLLSS